MARKRLTPAKAEFLQNSTGAVDLSRPESTAPQPAARSIMPPIAQVAAEASATHALQDLARDMEALRTEGRVILKIDLADIAMDHLARDRARTEPEAFAELVRSIKDHGQRMPIEVTLLPTPTEGGPKYGLISGWRRMNALEHLHKETGDAQYANVLALLRTPKDSAEAYVAMVEENEIRVGLSYYERAGIALEAVRRGVFETEKQALQSLYSSASRAKRSRIKAFIDLHKELGNVLRFPTSIPERFGLQLIYAMRETEGLAEHLRQELPKRLVADAEIELDLLGQLIAKYNQTKQRVASVAKPNVPHAEHLVEKLSNGIVVEQMAGKIVVSGEAVDHVLFDQICAFIKERKR